jgi:hypothetical protein
MTARLVGGKDYRDMNEEEKKEAEERDFRLLAPWLVTAFAPWCIQGSGRRMRKDRGRKLKRTGRLVHPVVLSRVSTMILMLPLIVPPQSETIRT